MFQIKKCNFMFCKMGSQYLITTKITLFQVNLQLNSLIGRYKETQL